MKISTIGRMWAGITLFTIIFFGQIARAQVPHLMSYQGRLLGEDGLPLPDKNYSVKFSIYDAPVAGVQLWSETQASLAAVDGLFGASLGSVSPILPSVFDGTERWLAVTIDGGPEQVPRTRLTSVGYAYQAINADKLDGVDASELEESAEIVAAIDAAISSLPQSTSWLSDQLYLWDRGHHHGFNLYDDSPFSLPMTGCDCPGATRYVTAIWVDFVEPPEFHGIDDTSCYDANYPRDAQLSITGIGFKVNAFFGFWFASNGPPIKVTEGPLTVQLIIPYYDPSCYSGWIVTGHVDFYCICPESLK
ncbi:MAG: hypothetical protein IH931_09090 [candidate division Zixibacteria bacterium]|nr:hypothetical protein [candidate division Zixibacteria bacterium]